MFSFTPVANEVGSYEFNVCGTIASGASNCQIFVIDVADNYSATNLLASWDVMFSDLKSMLSGTFSQLKNLVNAGASSNLAVAASSYAVPVVGGSGTLASPLNLNLNGNRGLAQSQTLDAGTAFNSQTSLTFEQWINPTAPTNGSAMIVSNANATSGLQVRQSYIGDGTIQASVGTPYTAAVLNNSPIAYYRLDETTGSTVAKDSSGLGNNGTYTGTAQITYGVTGPLSNDSNNKGISVNNSGGVYGVVKSPALTMTANAGFSIELWVNATGNANGTLFNISNEGGANPYYWLYFAGSTLVRIELGGGGTYVSGGSSTLSNAAGTWHHVVFTETYASNTAVIYWDGVIVYNNTLGTSYKPSAENIYFGSYQGGGSAPDSIVGSLDDIAVYNTVLQQADVTAHFSAKAIPTCVSAHPLLASAWSHLAAFFDNTSGTLGIFLNGVSECSLGTAGGILGGSTNHLFYGSDQAYGNIWDGKISEARVNNNTGLTNVKNAITGNFSATKDRYSFSNTPATISNLQAWFKADSLALSDGAAVGTWTESSPNAYAATQAVAGQKPIYKANIVNGLPVVRFSSASSQYLDLGTVLGKPANFTTFAVYQTTDASTRQDAFGSIDSSYTGAKGWGLLDLNNSAAGCLAHGWASDGTNSAWPRALSAITANTFYYTASAYVSGGTSSVPYINGVTPAYTVAGGTTPASNSGTAYSFSLGRAGAYNGNYFSGDLAEVIIYNKALSNAERAQVEAYLKNKYGL